jgi:hypothetical protein
MCQILLNAGVVNFNVKVSASGVQPSVTAVKTPLGKDQTF